MAKKKKIIVISSIALSSLIVSYFGLGLIGVAIAEGAFINIRNCDPNLLEEDFYRVQNCRPDYPSLNEREEISFPNGKETLKGYLYTTSEPKATIIFAHGVKNNADANGAQMQNYYLNHHYNVFAVDMTGCGRSSGKGIRTLYESRNCVKSAVNKVKELNKTKDLPIFLIGHSWGGYGVVAATDDTQTIAGVASFSGYNIPSEMMYGSAEAYTSKAVILTKPAMLFGVAMTWGSKAFYPAENMIKKRQDIPFVVIHGEEDMTVPFKTCSLYSSVINDNYPNVTAIKLAGMHHATPWKTLEAETYTAKCENDLKQLRKQYKGKLPDEVREEYIAGVDKAKASEINEALLNQIDEIFTSQIK